VTRDSSPSTFDPAVLGRPTLLPPGMTHVESTLVARSFGPKFAAALEQAPLGEWSGPIESAYGAHYVRVSARTPAIMPPLADVHAQVVREWENERRQRARNDAYTKMRGEYQVSIETKLATEQR